VSQVENDRSLVRPPHVLAFEEVAEETFLESDSVVGVEVNPVFESVYLEPFPLRAATELALEVASRVQMVRPVGGGELGTVLLERSAERSL